MRTPPLTCLILVLVCLLASCGKSQPNALDITTGPTPRFPDPNEKNKPQVDLLKDEIPPRSLTRSSAPLRGAWTHGALRVPASRRGVP